MRWSDAVKVSDMVTELPHLFVWVNPEVPVIFYQREMYIRTKPTFMRLLFITHSATSEKSYSAFLTPHGFLFHLHHSFGAILNIQDKFISLPRWWVSFSVLEIKDVVST